MMKQEVEIQKTQAWAAPSLHLKDLLDSGQMILITAYMLSLTSVKVVISISMDPSFHRTIRTNLNLINQISQVGTQIFDAFIVDKVMKISLFGLFRAIEFYINLSPA